jgi:endonuclease/exonuclease/phosphatase family metal-dependent hydrolase
MRRKWLWRALAVPPAVGLIALTYRVIFVYQLRPGACGMAGHAVKVHVAPPTETPTAQSAAHRAAGGPIRFLSYNIEGHAALVKKDHLEQIARVIQEQRPDVVALQEVHRGTWQARFADQAVELGRLTGMSVAFGPSFRALGGDFGNAILTRGTLHDVEVVALPSFGEPRSLLRARVEVDGDEVDVMATHLAAWGGVNRKIRTLQAQCLLEHARSRGRRFVLMGDFNAAPGSQELTAILSGQLVTMAGRPEETTHPLMNQRIDYILVGPGWSVGPEQVIHEGPSDHWPIAADLTVAPPMATASTVH